jgi:hypothetical protein
VAVAPFFAARYPGDRTWERLCSNASPTVRDAAAEAAASAGGPAHLEQLLLLCRDSVESVRLSAYVAFRSLRPEADQTGYDYKQPTDEALAKLEALLGG